MIALVVLLAHFVAAGSRGWNDDIEWIHSIDDAKKAASENGKPIFIGITKTFCGACKALRSVFANSDAIAELSTSFNMVHLEDDEEPKGEEYRPDGGYIPRILFANAKGELRSDVINEKGNAKYKYYYSSEDHVLAGMNSALAALK